MNPALTRTRRNMIGVSAIITAVFAFGWQFPSELRIFGNVIEASPKAVMIIAWASLAYFVWEYVVQLRPEIEELRTVWRFRFIQLHKRKLERREKKKYDEKALQIILDQRRNKGFESVHGVERIDLGARQTTPFSQEIHINVLITLGKNESRSHFQFPEPELYVANYFTTPLRVIRTWIFCVTTKGPYIEYVVPIAFPVFSVLSFAFGPFAWLTAGEAPNQAEFQLWWGF